MVKKIVPRDFIEYENFINQPRNWRKENNFMHFSEIPGDGMLYVNDSFKIKKKTQEIKKPNGKKYCCNDCSHTF